MERGSAGGRPTMDSRSKGGRGVPARRVGDRLSQGDRDRAGEQLACGYHVHVGISCTDEGVAVLDRAVAGQRIGNSASFQRAAYRRSGDLTDVIRRAVAVTETVNAGLRGVSAGWRNYPMVSMTVRNGAGGRLPVEPGETTKTRVRAPGLDGVRALAVLIVIGFHQGASA